MKIITSLLVLTHSIVSFGQKTQSDSTFIRIIKAEEVSAFVDSLKSAILRDTVNFKRSDILHTSTGARNTNSYSPVYFVNTSYAYKLDIINGTLVNEFVQNILDASKIENIKFLNIVSSQALFGINGMNGAIFLTMKKRSKINFNVAGIIIEKNGKRGNNFNQ